MVIAQSMAERDWERVKLLILREVGSQRGYVGLDEESEMSPIQTAAVYRPDVAHAMVDQGKKLDLFAAAALGISIKPAFTEEAANTQVEGNTPLGIAVRLGRTSVVKELLGLGVDPNQLQSRAGWFAWESDAIEASVASWRPLHIAVLHNYLPKSDEIIELLIENGANPNLTCTLGETPLHLAATVGYVLVVKLLTRLGVSVEQTTSKTSKAIVQLAGPPFDERFFPAKRTPLMIAASEGKTEVVEELLALGASTTATAEDGKTALHFAAAPFWGENVTIVQMLLSKGSPVNLEDRGGKRAIDYASEAKFTASVKLLSEWKK